MKVLDFLLIFNYMSRTIMNMKVNERKYIVYEMISSEVCLPRAGCRYILEVHADKWIAILIHPIFPKTKKMLLPQEFYVNIPYESNEFSDGNY